MSNLVFHKIIKLDGILAPVHQLIVTNVGPSQVYSLRLGMKWPFAWGVNGLKLGGVESAAGSADNPEWDSVARPLIRTNVRLGQVHSNGVSQIASPMTIRPEIDFMLVDYRTDKPYGDGLCITVVNEHSKPAHIFAWLAVVQHRGM